MKNIVFFGDSLTAGYGLVNVHNESLPALIQQKIDALGLQYKAINAGLSGDTTRGGLSRLDYWLSRPLDIFVLELGINDVIRGVPVSTTKQNLRQIINRVKAKYPQVKIALMGMQLPRFLTNPRVEAFSNIYKELAHDDQLPFVPFYLDGVAGKRHLNLQDGLHPSAEGYKIIAENVWPLIKSLL